MKKKGFTLIELLAVIVILALVLAIAIPSINKYLNQSKTSAYNAQLSTIIEAAQAYASTNTSLLQNNPNNVTKITLGQLKSVGFIKYDFKNPINDKYFADELTINIVRKGSSYEYEIDEDTIDTRDGTYGPTIYLNGDPVVFYNVNGTYKELGASAVEYNGNALIDIDVDSTSLNMGVEGVYQVKYSVSDTKGATTTAYRNIVVSKNAYSNGTLVYFNPNTNSSCSKAEALSNTGKNAGCMAWYTFLDDGGSTIKLLLDHNTTLKVAWSSVENNADGPKEVIAALNSDISSWNADVKKTARLITAKEIANITNNSIWTANGDAYYLHNNSASAYEGEMGTNEYSWLFNNTASCMAYGCDTTDSNTNGYWTSTRKTNTLVSAWSIFSDGGLHFCNVTSANYSGVRPVIEIPKSLLR